MDQEWIGSTTHEPTVELIRPWNHFPVGVAFSLSLAHPFVACPCRIRFGVLQLDVPIPVALGFARQTRAKPWATGRSRVPAVSTPKQGWWGKSPDQPERILPLPYFLLPTSYFLLPTSYSGLIRVRDPIAKHGGCSVGVVPNQGGEIIFDIATRCSQSRWSAFPFRRRGERLVFFFGQRA